ncbi:YARHG domain-containing protein [Hyalangium gracile]|uniref:YARHG domain-containing protein n=1 Tax=Hyalangium gracile TaxID=394092 RepID=UPI001CCBC978|nr:YARHG domain-containing protein [Hyalangium gracile]
MRLLALASLVLAAPAMAEQPPEYVPAPANQIPGYSETVFPCEAVRGWKEGRTTVHREDEMTEEKLGAWTFDPGDVEPSTYIVCKGNPRLEALSLRELSILRNTIFARYGWGGFRKPWLREHFQKQPWYKPDPKFSYKRLGPNDRRNVELIAQAEMSLRYADLEQMRDPLLAKAGKWWGDIPFYQAKDGEFITACEVDESRAPPKEEWEMKRVWEEKFEKDAFASKDCRYHSPSPPSILEAEDNKPVSPDLSKLSAEERIELGLISRAMGEFAVDTDRREQTVASLDKVLSVKELRELSLRDLRLLRNTIFARRGRSFKSELLQEHFEHMPWYKPDPAYSDKRLTKTDKRNIELIRQVEGEFGGALKDKDFAVDNPSSAEDVDGSIAPVHAA